MALETEFMTRLSSLADRKLSVRLQARSSSRYLYLLNQRTIVRTGRRFSSSIHTAT